MDIKGKSYTTVNERVAQFRKDHPDWGIDTDIIQDENGVAKMKTTITNPEGRIVSTGMAYEKEGSSFINKTSYIENCETSAVGRALGFLGYGNDESSTSMASAEEVGNAQLQQKATNESEMLKALINSVSGSAPDMEARILRKYKVDYIENMTKEQLIEAANALKGAIEKSRAKASSGRANSGEPKSFQEIVNES